MSRDEATLLDMAGAAAKVVQFRGRLGKAEFVRDELFALVLIGAGVPVLAWQARRARPSATTREPVLAPVVGRP